jgi:hypothetical protein
MKANRTRLTHEIAIQLHLVAESFTICSSPGSQSGNFWIHPRVLVTDLGGGGAKNTTRCKANSAGSEESKREGCLKNGGLQHFQTRGLIKEELVMADSANSKWSTNLNATKTSKRTSFIQIINGKR